MVITQNALVVFFGPWGSWFAAIALFFFAFTTILGNYSYAESGLLYLGGGDIGLFLALLFLFLRFLPMISIFEMRTLVPDAKPEEAAR